MSTTILIGSLVITLRWLPIHAIPALGRFIGRLAQRFHPRRRSILRANMAATGYAPDLLEQQVYSHFGSALLITLLPPQRSAELFIRAPVVDGMLASAAETFAADCRLGGVIVCSAHVGVWELVPAALCPHIPLRARRLGAIVYQPLHDAPLDRWLLRRRTEAAGMALLPARGSWTALYRALRSGGLVGLVADQRPAKGRARMSASLLGQASEFSPGLAALHCTTGAPVWYAVVLIERSMKLSGRGGSSFALRLHLERLAQRAPASQLLDEGRLNPPAAEGEASMLMQAYADAVSRTVRSAPSQYYWLHRRFAGMSTSS